MGRRRKFYRGDNYRCADCGAVNDSNNLESDYCTLCQAERRAAWEEDEWDRKREERLLRRDNEKVQD